MTARSALGAARAELLKFGRIVYLYAPIPVRVKDILVATAYRVAGKVFRGERHYELWRRRHEPHPASAPVPAAHAACPTVLVIDRYIPQPDRDAGSRSMWCVLRALKNMGLHVQFWPQDLLWDPENAPALQQLGIELLCGEALRYRFGTWLARHGGQIDYVFIARPLVTQDFLPALRKHTRAKVLYWGVDIHHERLLAEYQLTGNRAFRWEAGVMRKLEQSLWRKVDAIYHPSDSETRTVLSVVPGARARTLPIYFFDQAPDRPTAPDGRAGILFVAGFGHWPNADAAQWLVHAIMPLVRVQWPHVHLSLVGSNPTEEVRALAGPDVTVTGYVTDEKLLAYYRSARVAVVPLRSGAGVKGKVVEALFNGLPLVTTPVGAQGLGQLESVVPVADDAESLARHLSALLADDRQWLEVATRAQAYAVQRFSPQAMEDVLRQDIEVTPA